MDALNRVGSMLSLIADRQSILSENLANMDTVDYKRKDISFGQYLSAGQNTLETKLSNKLGGSPVLEELKSEPVNPANELIEMQKNSLLYTVATRNIASTITQMKTVIAVGK